MKLSPSDIIGWFRDQANEFNAIADRLEGTFNSAVLTGNKPLTQNSEPKAEKPQRDGPVSTEEIKESLGRSGASRVAILAQKLGASEGDIRKVIEAHPETFTKGKRGWIRLHRVERISS